MTASTSKEMLMLEKREFTSLQTAVINNSEFRAYGSNSTLE